MEANVEPQVKPVTEVPVKKSKERRATEKALEHIMKSLNGLSTPEEKLAAVCKKYTEMIEENKKLVGALKDSERKTVMMQKEKDQILLENNRNILMKDKLEHLCRELQKQNKEVRDESLQKIKEEEEKRKRTQEKMQMSFNEITTLMQQNNEKNMKLRDDNLDITEKFKSVVEQYELREKQVDKMAKHMALESQLTEAKINKANLEMQAEREKMLAEKEKLLLQIQVLQVKCKNMQSNEVLLLQQIAVCNEKISDFQEVFNKRNTVFGDLKGELEKMSKKILKLEKENIEWRQKWEKSHTALLEMAVEKKMRDQNTLVQSRQVAQMQRLCRIMKAERAGLLQTLKDHNIERPPFQQVADVEIIPPPETTEKLDAMTANCAILKQNLANLQGELNAYVNKNEKNMEPPSSINKENESSDNNKTANTSQKPKQKRGKNKKKGNSAANEVVISDAKPAEEAPVENNEIASEEPSSNLNGEASEVEKICNDLLDKVSIVENNIHAENVPVDIVPFNEEKLESISVNSEEVKVEPTNTGETVPEVQETNGPTNSEILAT